MDFCRRSAFAGDLPFDLPFFREAPQCLLGKDQLAVAGHFKDSPRTGDQRDFGDFVKMLLEQFFRQTDGFRQVPSGSAVLNGQFQFFHGQDPPAECSQYSSLLYYNKNDGDFSNRSYSQPVVNAVEKCEMYVDKIVDNFLRILFDLCPLQCYIGINRYAVPREIKMKGCIVRVSRKSKMV